MVEVNKSVVARYKFAGENFEVLVDCDKAMEFKQGASVSLADILAVDKIFSDAKKAKEATPAALKKVFNTDDTDEIAKQIIKKGEVQLTAEYRNRLREAKRKQIVYLIHKNGVDPRTHAPHPVTAIESAMEEAKVNIDGNKAAELQMNDVLAKIRPLIPIKFEVKEIEVIVPGKYTGSTYPLLKSFGKILKEEWMNDGSHCAVIELPGGMQEEFYNKLNSLTHGDNATKILKTR